MNPLIEEGILVKKQIIKDKGYLDKINTLMYDFLKIKNTTHKRTDNCLHHLLTYDKYLFLEILEILLSIKEIHHYFNYPFIMHSFGAVINKSSKKSYTHNWHIDTYEETNERCMLNILIPLCDFTLENGCTQIFPKNSDSYRRVCLNKGDILCFNSSLKHCTGNNTTSYDRNCLTITFVKMYLKPQFDYISLYTEKELEQIKKCIKVLLNYESKIPKTLTDFYNKKYRLK